MIDLDEIEKRCKHEINLETANPYAVNENPIHAMLELITRLRQAEKLNAELKDRMSHIGMYVGIATTGQVPSEHPIKSRLEMVAKLAKDAARYRWLRERHDQEDDSVSIFINDEQHGAGHLDAQIDEAMKCK